MSESVYILGGGRTDFKRNLKKEGKTIRHIIIEAGKKAIEDAKIDPGEIQAGAVGNFNAGQFTKQLQLGAFIPEIDPKLRGIPTMHTEAACASGALSVLLGAEWIMGGFYDAVLVVGAEQQKTMSSLDGSDVLGAAADYHNEKPEYGDFMFPKLFGRIAQIYIEKYGATEADLALVAWKNYAHAKLNPLAQMRDADLTLDCASQVSDKNPSVAPPLKVSDCSQITDGAASVVLVSGKYLDKIGRDRNKTARLLGYGHSTDYLPLDKKDAPTFSIARKAAEKAFRMANLTPSDLQGAEVHLEHRDVVGQHHRDGVAGLEPERPEPVADLVGRGEQLAGGALAPVAGDERDALGILGGQVPEPQRHLPLLFPWRPFPRAI